MKIVLRFLLLNLVSAAEQSVVTLSHGGQLQGRRTQLNGQVLDQFLGVRYAKPPIGDRRFRKPAALEPWSGVINATTAGNSCLQVQYESADSDPEITGDEDCLYLDITAPSGITTGVSKAVMVWIHGGGYLTGTGSIYIGAPLALHGDVIVVSINYRLGVMGFLTEETMGTGNYALWDQRAAIMWVKDNIAAFGGNPELITIFGESAGAGSVVAQMMGAHNDGLFQRGIAESGSLYQPVSWYLSLGRRAEIARELKEQVGCTCNSTLLECLRNMDARELVGIADPYSYELIFHPVPDEDFFPPNIQDETYNLTSRFDLLIGYNERDVSTYFIQQLNSYSTRLNESVSDGTSMAAASNYLSDLCQTSYVDSAVELCVEFFMDLYKLRELEDKHRYLTLINLIKHYLFSTDTTRLLQFHSQFNKSTYAYQFGKFVDVPLEHLPSSLPSWVERKAVHANELFYLFRFDQFNNSIKEGVNHTFIEMAGDFVMKFIIKLEAEFATESDKQFSKAIQTLWTNFAKTGNPNNPVTVSAPTWPEFTMTNQTFMSLSDDMKSIEAPDLAIHNQIISLLYPARRRKVTADTPAQVVTRVVEVTPEPCKSRRSNGAVHAKQEMALVSLCSMLCFYFSL